MKRATKTKCGARMLEELGSQFRRQWHVRPTVCQGYERNILFNFFDDSEHGAFLRASCRSLWNPKYAAGLFVTCFQFQRNI